MGSWWLGILLILGLAQSFLVRGRVIDEPGDDDALKTHPYKTSMMRRFREIAEKNGVVWPDMTEENGNNSTRGKRSAAAEDFAKILKLTASIFKIVGGGFGLVGDIYARVAYSNKEAKKMHKEYRQKMEDLLPEWNHTQNHLYESSIKVAKLISLTERFLRDATTVAEITEYNLKKDKAKLANASTEFGEMKEIAELLYSKNIIIPEEMQVESTLQTAAFYLGAISNLAPIASGAFSLYATISSWKIESNLDSFAESKSNELSPVLSAVIPTRFVQNYGGDNEDVKDFRKLSKTSDIGNWGVIAQATGEIIGTATTVLSTIDKLKKAEALHEDYVEQANLAKESYEKMQNDIKNFEAWIQNIKGVICNISGLIENVIEGTLKMGCQINAVNIEHTLEILEDQWHHIERALSHKASTVGSLKVPVVNNWNEAKKGDYDNTCMKARPKCNGWPECCVLSTNSKDVFQRLLDIYGEDKREILIEILEKEKRIQKGNWSNSTFTSNCHPECGISKRNTIQTCSGPDCLIDSRNGIQLCPYPPFNYTEFQQCMEQQEDHDARQDFLLLNHKALVPEACYPNYRECPVGYVLKTGPELPGRGSIKSYPNMATKEDCKRKCDATAGCYSFQYSSSIEANKTCHLNHQKKAITGEERGLDCESSIIPKHDFVFCRKLCPPGYIGQPGSISRQGNLGNLGNISDVDKCATECNNREGCISFEHNREKSICQLSSQKIASDDIHDIYSSFCAKTVTNLKILNLNVWDMISAEDNEERIRALHDHIKDSDYDIVTIQELWHNDKYNLLETEETMINGTFYTPNKSISMTPFGIAGRKWCGQNNETIHPTMIGCTGLTMLSRHPIKKSKYTDYTDRINVLAENFVERGALSATLSVNGFTVSFITTHLATWYSSYGLGGHDETEHQDIRNSQAQQLVDIIEEEEADFVVVTGDMNATPSSSTMDVFKVAGLKDAFEEKHGGSADTSLFHTYGYRNNSYSGHEEGFRIDYVIYKENASTNLMKTTTVVKEANILERDLSDHNGLVVEFQLNVKNTP